MIVGANLKMFRLFWVSFFRFFLTVLGITAFLWGLREAAAYAGLDHIMPATYARLSNWVNHLVSFWFDHAFLFVVVCAFAAYIWVLIVVEPRTVSKRQFEKRRLKLRS